MNGYDFSSVYSGLKDFQLATVEYVFERMYTDRDSARRFLVADEVGLGKTLVARGVIARAIEHLDEEGIERIDVVYICSNSDIARQNINRLNVTGQRDFSFASRITLLAAQLEDLTKNRLNFVSFTPGTSFDLKSNMGTQDERKLLYWLVKEHWGSAVGTKKGPKRVFQGGVTDFGKWEERLKRYRSKARRVDPGLKHRFFEALDEADAAAHAEGGSGLKERFKELASEWAHDRSHTWPERHARAVFIGDLRNLLARTTIDALEPDLVILDEFQRFKHLLDGDTDAAKLAHSMFNYADEHAEARVLLLSATPYKMYTLTDETAHDDHYQDFLRTVEFLKEGDADELRSGLSDLRRELVNLGAPDDTALLDAKSRVEAELRKVMARTERLAVTTDRQGMLTQATTQAGAVTAGDLVAAVRLQHASDRLEAGGMVEYWKSTPYFANFWGDYKIGREFRRAEDTDPFAVRDIRELLRTGQELLDWASYESWDQIDAGNARLRTLIDQTLDNGDWKRLWLAPSMPYYQLGAPWDEPGARTATKRLAFSAWSAVPRSVSSLLSYEADRRIAASMAGGRRRPNTPDGREKFSEPLRFPKKGTGMTAFGFVYPSPSLAQLADPLRLAQQLIDERDQLPTSAAILERAAEVLVQQLAPFLPAHGSVDDRWYWAAPLVLDAQLPNDGDWLQGEGIHQAWMGPDVKKSAGFELHIDIARSVADGTTQLGRPPEDLGEVLALLAVGGPGNVALRSLGRLYGDEVDYRDMELRDESAQIAWAFRSLFNTPEAATLIRGLRWGDGNPYWRKPLHYAVDGCLQAVMDEYIHVLREWLGILDLKEIGAVSQIANTVSDVVALRAADLRARDPHAPPDGAERRMRSRFALPFAKHKSEEEKDTRRAGYVRAAFNSPFWPNVLTTTSVGQEGLDFHLYCHAVVHWNLPANPVDLEQREGRVHRYMGHAVRKNLATAHMNAALSNGARNPWDAVLDAAIESREADVSDIVPYWIYPGDAQIERHVPALPLSREIARLEDLQRSLAVYRLVFGQPRQEELMTWLAQLGVNERQDLVDALRVDLSPVSGSSET